MGGQMWAWAGPGWRKIWRWVTKHPLSVFAGATTLSAALLIVVLEIFWELAFSAVADALISHIPVVAAYVLVNFAAILTALLCLVVSFMWGRMVGLKDHHRFLLTLRAFRRDSHRLHHDQAAMLHDVLESQSWALRASECYIQINDRLGNEEKSYARLVARAQSYKSYPAGTFPDPYDEFEDALGRSEAIVNGLEHKFAELPFLKGQSEWPVLREWHQLPAAKGEETAPHQFRERYRILHAKRTRFYKTVERRKDELIRVIHDPILFHTKYKSSRNHESAPE
ncbi:hypothetical protein [Maricaulis sp.]|uniref:hypothetical protein n=1 Tax=Maricaulis sp. TaxID=1486257 RepID=UPI003A90C14E